MPAPCAGAAANAAGTSSATATTVRTRMKTSRLWCMGPPCAGKRWSRSRRARRVLRATPSRACRGVELVPPPWYSREPELMARPLVYVPALGGHRAIVGRAGGAVEDGLTSLRWFVTVCGGGAERTASEWDRRGEGIGAETGCVRDGGGPRRRRGVCAWRRRRRPPSRRPRTTSPPRCAPPGGARSGASPRPSAPRRQATSRTTRSGTSGSTRGQRDGPPASCPEGFGRAIS